MTGKPVAGATPSTVLLGNNDVLFTNQFYSPATASWTATGPVPRQAFGPHLVTMLPTGNVLGSGTTCHYSGCGGKPTAFCFLYTPSTNSWSLTGSMNQARIDHTSTLLLNGKVLVAGGTNGSTVLSSAELYTLEFWPCAPHDSLAPASILIDSSRDRLMTPVRLPALDRSSVVPASNRWNSLLWIASRPNAFSCAERYAVEGQDAL